MLEPDTTVAHSLAVLPAVYQGLVEEAMSRRSSTLGLNLDHVMDDVLNVEEEGLDELELEELKDAVAAAQKELDSLLTVIQDQFAVMEKNEHQMTLLRSQISAVTQAAEGDLAKIRVDYESYEAAYISLEEQQTMLDQTVGEQEALFEAAQRECLLMSAYLESRMISVSANDEALARLKSEEPIEEVAAGPSTLLPVELLEGSPATPLSLTTTRVESIDRGMPQLTPMGKDDIPITESKPWIPQRPETSVNLASKASRREAAIRAMGVRSTKLRTQ